MTCAAPSPEAGRHQAPEEVHGDVSASGSKSYSVTPGHHRHPDQHRRRSGRRHADGDSVTTGAFDDDAPVADADTKKYTVTVPAGALAARFSVDSRDDTADLDLYVYKGGELVALSASGAADEQTTINAPGAGTYDVYVNGFATPGGSTSYGISELRGHTGQPGQRLGHPVADVHDPGQPLNLSANWTGLDPTKRGSVVISYSGADDRPTSRSASQQRAGARWAFSRQAPSHDPDLCPLPRRPRSPIIGPVGQGGGNVPPTMNQRSSSACRVSSVGRASPL